MAFVTKEQMVEVFVDTQQWYSSDATLQKSIEKSIAGTLFYEAENYPALPDKKFDSTKISVIQARTFETAFNLHKDNPDARIAVHNFASATNPGGGVVHGSRAQEEALCRCSTLYPVLDTEENFQRYYDFHYSRQDSRYTDACIYTPNIVVCKSDIDVPERLPKNDWIKVDVMTCAAPNLRRFLLKDYDLFEIHKKRARHMLTVLAANGVDIFVTGAFGCGAFQNNPKTVAQAYEKILPEFNGYFKEIVFAIYCTPREMTNFETFKEILS